MITEIISFSLFATNLFLPLELPDQFDPRRAGSFRCPESRVILPSGIRNHSAARNPESLEWRESGII
jgi:hypothetical protein